MKLTKFIIIFGFFILLILSGCALKDNPNEPLPDSENGKLGNLCTGRGGCSNFCLNNRGLCKNYCNENKENELCRIVFSGEEKRDLNWNDLRQDKCEGTKIKFDYAPVNLDKTSLMLPLGLMVDSHVTPVDHHYFQNFSNENYDIEIYSPGDGYITDIQHMPGAEEGKDYRLVIRHTCTISSIYIYVSNLPEKIKAYAPEKNGFARVNIPVKAGELLGYYKDNLDYNLVDEELTLSGFVVPEHYSEPWKIHIPNTYEYFNEPVKNKLIEKSIRTAEPISGKIDYDIDGRLVGNWFLEGTNGYRGTEQNKYWLGHLTFAYDYIDPSRIVISIGDYNGENSRQFAVKNNFPDPANIGTENGIVKYELVGYDYITPSGTSWDMRTFVKGLRTKIDDFAQAAVMVQLIGDRKLKLEAFPGKTAADINGFTENAKIYER